MVGLEKAKCFLNALRNITGSVATVDDRDLMNHYRIFVANLEILFIKSYKEFDPSIFGSKEIIQSILKKENIALFRNVKVIIHLICVACAKVSVESVVESLVSRYEKHFDSSRQPTEQHSLDEMIIAENRPLLHHADEILERAMNRYWRVAKRYGKWHFLRRTEDIHLYTGSCIRLSESCWIKSLNYHSCKTVNFRYGIF